MPDLKLPRLPDRTPVKLTIAMLPELHQALLDYASVYSIEYGHEEPVADLIPACCRHSWPPIAALQRPARRSRRESDDLH